MRESMERQPGQSKDIQVRVKGQKEKAAGNEQAVSTEKAATQRPSMAVEGEEAVELYARQITRNLTELEEQVGLLREVCARTEKLLRDVE
jgi:hypothetical protein